MSDSLRPFFSIMMVIVSLFLIVFVKMEARRVNYSILRQSRQYQILSDRYHKDLMTYLKLTQGSRLTDIARSQLTLDQARKGQVILLVGGRLPFLNKLFKSIEKWSDTPVQWDSVFSDVLIKTKEFLFCVSLCLFFLCCYGLKGLDYSFFRMIK